MQILPSISSLLALLLAIAAPVKTETARNVKSYCTNVNAATRDNVILVGRSQFDDHNTRFSEQADCILINFTTLDELECELIKMAQDVNVRIVLPTVYSQMKLISINRKYLEEK